MFQSRSPYAVAAIVSAYKCEEFLAQRLRNLVSLNLYREGGLQIVVVDSGSPQRERDIAAAFMRDHMHMVYIRTAERESVYSAWNRGIRSAQAEYVINANADDRFLPHALDCMRRVMDSDPACQAVYGDWLQTDTANDQVDSSGSKITFRYPDFFAPLLFHCQITGHAVMLRKTVFEQIGYYDGEFEIYGDREFMFRFAAAGLAARKLDLIVGLYYNNGGGLENANGKLGDAEYHRIMCCYLAPRHFIRLFGMDEIPAGDALSELYAQTGVAAKGILYRNDQPVSNLGTAGKLFQTALSHDPLNLTAINNLGVVCCCIGKFEKGIALFEKALKQASAVQEDAITANLASALRRAVQISQYVWFETHRHRLHGHPTNAVTAMAGDQNEKGNLPCVS